MKGASLGLGLVWIVIIAVFAIISFGGFVFPSHGEHSGVITATETNWMIWNTKAIYFKTNAMSSQEDTYCVVDDGVYKKLQDFQVSKTPVTIHYDNGFFMPKWDCAMGLSIITDVTE